MQQSRSIPASARTNTILTTFENDSLKALSGSENSKLRTYENFLRSIGPNSPLRSSSERLYSRAPDS
jgi:hypothetical protein